MIENEGNDNMTESITFAIDPELKSRFEEAISKEERSISSGLRLLIKKYLGDIK